MRPIDRVQKERRMSLARIATSFAERGLSLNSMAQELKLNYSSLKRGLRLRGYSHPVGIDLVAAKIKAETRWELKEYVAAMIEEGLSRNAIAKELGVDNKTLQAYGDANKLVFPDVRPIPMNFTNIAEANRRRVLLRTDLIWLELYGEKKYLEQWVVERKLNRSALVKRLALGWSVEDALTTPIGQRRKSGKKVCAAPRRPAETHPWRSAWAS